MAIRYCLAVACIALSGGAHADEIGQALGVLTLAGLLCNQSRRRRERRRVSHRTHGHVRSRPDATGRQRAGQDMSRAGGVHVIDGRTRLRAHGGPMPVYGDIFGAEFDDHGT